MNAKAERLAEMIRRARALKTPMPTLIAQFERCFAHEVSHTTSKSEQQKPAELVFMRVREAQP
jgi:hypothetical protein